jgi:hypothetical protein
MSPNKKAGGRNRIPIEFLDTEQDSEENNDSPNEPGRDNGSVEDLPEQFANPEGASEEEDASDDSIDASSELDDGDLDDDLEEEELRIRQVNEPRANLADLYWLSWLQLGPS